MCEVVDKFVERGRRQGIQQGMEQGIQQGIQEEKNRCAKAFVAETVKQKQSKEYITGILRTCFQLQEEEALALYRECEVYI